MKNLLSVFKSETQIIQEIHNSFDNAQDELLSQAKAIIESCENNDHLSKAERLKAIGFTQTELVKSAEKQKQRLVESRSDAELVEYYKQNYPFQKFLKESQLDEICEKYNLVYAPVSKYLKDVPEKNLRDIENATDLKEGDSVGIEKTYELINRYKTNKDRFDKFNLQMNNGSPIYSEDKVKELTDNYHPDITTAVWVATGRFNGIHVDYKKTTINKIGLFIAAPKSHFDTSGLTKKGKFGFMSVTVREVKDPIVFRYCRGGIQVITKWGLEASDEMLVNEIEN